MSNFIATKVSVRESGATSGSERYAGTRSPSMVPSPYCPRTERVRTSSSSMGWIACKILACSSRTALASNVIGGSAIYRVQLADEIDPERTNIAVPNTHQKVLSYGTDFAYVRQTLMTA